MNRTVGISRRFLLACVCLAAISVVMLGSVRTVGANVPVVVSIANASTATELMATITVAHIDGMSATTMHYIDIIEVNVGGNIKVFTFDNPLQGTPFVNTFDLGPLPATPVTVSVRAHCSVYGWSDVSSSVAVPEFPVGTLGVFAIALAATLLAMKRQRQIHG